MTFSITRRDWLAAALSVATPPPKKKSQQLPNVGEFFRFLDPLTETPVVRLTSPSSTSFLPAPGNPFVSLKDRFLVFSSDRTGTLTPFQLNLHTGALRPLAQTSKLDPRSLFLDDHRKLLYLIDDGALREIALSSKKVNTITTGISAFTLAPSGFVVVAKGRLEHLTATGSTLLAEDVASWCLVRPNGEGCAFGRGQSHSELSYVALDAPSPKPVHLAAGEVWNPVWSPGGESLLFLRQTDGAAGSGPQHQIREVPLENGTERLVAATSFFSCFSPNGNGSVFVGASGSQAQPTVNLLIRSVQRELILCEHRASNPATVSPVFSPDSRRVYFESDHEGKSALYSVNIELLVDPTPPSAI